jgi:hypothetical protein
VSEIQEQTPTEVPSETLETHIEGIHISEQQIPHGIYSSSAGKKRDSPTASEMAFHI